MIIEEKILSINHEQAYAGKLDFERIYALLQDLKAQNILCINPREGQMLKEYLPQNAIIDSFVSDDEWLEAAGRFSQNVYTGSSHHPLLPIVSEKYDLVLVCEDFAMADDCDAMAVQYHRLLKKGGILLCGLWNMSYHENIKPLLTGDGVPGQSFANSLCGYAVIPLDNLTARLKELGFVRTDIFCLYGEASDVSPYVAVSKKNINPMPDLYFLTKYFFLQSQK